MADEETLMTRVKKSGRNSKDKKTTAGAEEDHATNVDAEESPSTGDEDTEASKREVSGGQEISGIKLQQIFVSQLPIKLSHGYTRHIEYHRCIAAKGDGAQECQRFAKYYRSLCPMEWIQRWNERRANGTFPGPL